MSDPLTNYLSGVATATPAVVTLDHLVEAAVAKRFLSSLPEHDKAVIALDASPSNDSLSEHIVFALDLGGPAGVVAQYVTGLLPAHDRHVLASAVQLAKSA